MTRDDFSTPTTPFPEHYRSPDCPELGEVEELLYGTTYYAGDGRPLLKPCYVYTPFGYDPGDTDTQYPILYFMHGFLCNANSMFEGDDGAIGNIFDWLIYEKKVRPFIAVAVTWDYENAIRDFQTSFDQILQFHQEFRRDLVPAVESRYHTFAETTDAKGLRASREHRAFAGYSMGAVTAWQIFLLCGDLCKWYAPLACDCWALGRFGGAKQAADTAEMLASAATVFHLAPEDYFFYCGAGDKDPTLLQQIPQIFEMWKYDPQEADRPKPFQKENLTLHIVPGGEHGVPACEELLYNAVPARLGNF
ncbi:MAG: hypothetical protein J5847_01255 [Clostridia bacterium]|nr:hypothetical protein [Clostridia bacterium]